MKTTTFFVAGLITFACLQTPALAQRTTVSDDKDWDKQNEFLQQANEAEYIIRVGDIDNLGFGWPDNFDPFCGKTTDVHNYPWKANKKDLPGLDRILLSSLYKPTGKHDCGGDGYSGAYDPASSKPVTYSIPVSKLQGVSIKNAYLQLFIDDFQAPTFCSKFRVTVNGIRFTECERIINAIDQTGPVGKLLTIPVPEEFYAAITKGPALELKIDEVTGAADGFAIDFIRLLLNRNKENGCKGNISGQVIDKSSSQPIPYARVVLTDKSRVSADAQGRFFLTDVPTGFELLTATATGYNDGTATADIGPGDENAEVQIFLETGGQALFDKSEISVGESISLENLLFDQGKAEIKPEAQPVLDKVAAFLKDNKNAEIELSGHTSSEGDAAKNRSLSYRRVKACRDYIVLKGIDQGRIIVFGYGPDRPVVSNDTEANRAKNRRVEMRLVKL